jgi:hypothetical protein
MARENLQITKLENTNVVFAVNNVGNSASTLLTLEEVQDLVKELNRLSAPPLTLKPQAQ